MAENEHLYYKQQKQKSFILALILILCILFSICFIILEAEHDCTGEDCPVCISLAQCEELIQKFGLWSVFIAVCKKLFSPHIVPFIGNMIRLSAKTPVTLKIQLNN